MEAGERREQQLGHILEGRHSRGTKICDGDCAVEQDFGFGSSHRHGTELQVGCVIALMRKALKIGFVLMVSSLEIRHIGDRKEQSGWILGKNFRLQTLIVVTRLGNEANGIQGCFVIEHLQSRLPHLRPSLCRPARLHQVGPSLPRFVQYQI